MKMHIKDEALPDEVIEILKTSNDKDEITKHLWIITPEVLARYTTIIRLKQIASILGLPMHQYGTTVKKADLIRNIVKYAKDEHDFYVENLM